MLLALLLPAEAPDGRSRLAGKDKGLPAGVGLLGLGPAYLYLITVLDLRPERHDAPVDLRSDRLEIGRASCRERVCQYVSLSGVAGSITKQHNKHKYSTKM